LGCDISIECAAKLVDVFQWSFPWAEVRETGVINSVGSETYNCFDYQIPFGSIPPLFRKTLDDFRIYQKPYIPRLKEGEKKVRDNLKLTDGELLIGLCWRSSNQAGVRSKGYLQVEDLVPLKGIQGATFLAVQYDDCLPELEEVRALGLPIHYYTNVDQKNDLASTCALLGACDLVISAATAVAQLSASLGVPTLIFSSEKVTQNQIPWHPTVKRIQLNQEDPESLARQIFVDQYEIVNWANQVTNSTRVIIPY